MRIAYVCSDRGIPLRGVKGASAHLRSLSAALSRRGHEVVIACRRIEGPNPLPAGLSAVELHRDATAGQLAELFVKCRTEAVVERYSLGGGGALAAAAELALPYLLEVNAPLADEAVRYRGLEDADLWRRREADLFAAAGRILAVSSAIRDHVVGAGAAPAKVAVVPNGVDLAAFAGSHGEDVRSRLGLAGRFVVGFTGSLKAWHGVDVLLRAFAGLAGSAFLVIVGDGPERDWLEELAGSLGIRERTAFVGAVPHSEVPSWLRAMDVGVAPYVRQASFYFSPLKIAEYLAAGLPVVASHQGDIRELVGGAGVLVPPDDALVLRDALERLQRDAALRARLGAAARERAQSLDWDVVALRVEELLMTRRVVA